MSNKSNHMPVQSDEYDMGKVKPFRTSARLKLPPREEKPEDDSVYDRFLGAVEKKDNSESIKIESSIDEASQLVETSSSSHSSIDVANLRPVEQRTDDKLSQHEDQRIPKLQPAVDTSNVQGFNIEKFLKDINKIYRLNGGESSVLRFLLEMSHALGRDECEATVPKIMAQTGLSEQRVRRNLKFLRNKGWIRQIKEFDPYKHTAALYKIFLAPE